MDKYFRVEVVTQTPNPQQAIWISQHQCVCEDAAIDDPCPSEDKAGEYVVKHLLVGDRGHWSPAEAPQITFNVIGFNHRTMQQITRHRVGVHFSVQSLRYTGSQLIKAVKASYDAVQNWEEHIEKVVYFRPVGVYRDRSGKKYEYTYEQRYDDLVEAQRLLERYRVRIEEQGWSEEQAAGMLPMDTRQHWVMSLNVRSFCHMADLRWKADAQYEAQCLIDLTFPHFKAWVPAIADWYEKNRAKKARLAP